MLIVAHRGASADATENTLDAFRFAWRQGADAIETDLRLTADGEVVALHDPDLARIHRVNQHLRRISFATLRTRAPRVPTLAEILEISPPSAHLVLELKEGPELLAPIATTLATRPDLQITCIAFDYEVIAETKRRFPHHAALWLLNRIPPNLTSHLDAAHLDGIDLRYSPTLTHSKLGIRDAKILYTFTVNDEKSATHCHHLGIQALTTDTPGLARSWGVHPSRVQ